MNKLFALIAATLVPGMITTALAQSDQDGHVLVSRWKTYQKNVDADKPKECLAVLEDIKDAALAGKYAWDYYDACRTFAQVRSAINWKDRQEAQLNFKKEIESFGEPVARFYLSIGEDKAKAKEFAASFRKQLAAASNDQFWKHDGRIPSYMYGIIANDYEYTQWSLFLAGEDPSELEAMFGDKYPQAALVEYTLAGRSKDSVARMRELAAKYKGKAVGYLAAHNVLEADFLKLQKDNAGENEYRNFLAECQAHEKGRKSLSGQEAKIAAGASSADLIEELKSKEINFSVKEGELTVRLRNLPSSKVEILKSEKSVWSTVLENKACRFYVQDTLKCTLPVIDDGEYLIQCSHSGVTESSTYEKYSIATSYRNDSRHMAVYAADRISGEPLRRFEIIVLDNSDKELGRKVVTAQDGFTNLPEELEKLFEKRKARSIRIAAERGGIKLLSQDISAFKSEVELVEKEDNRQSACVLTDRSAFNPGETVNYKVVLYSGRYSFAASPAGMDLKAVFKDADGNELESADLKTGEFGSAAGSFKIPSAQKGGYYRIEIVKDKRLASKMILVDEFVLPSFELKWENEDDKLFFVGDTLRFRGALKAYSGHSLASATIAYEVSRGYSGESLYGELKPEPDGSFEIEVQAAEQGSYALSVNVTDATGETLEFSDSRYVRCDLAISSITLKNAASGEFTLSDASARCAGALTSDEAQFNINMDWSGHTRYTGTSTSYRLLKDGTELRNGTVADACSICVDLAGLASGVYEIEAVVRAVSQSGKEILSPAYKTRFIKVSESDTVLPDGISSFYLNVGKYEVLVGVAKGPVWLVVEMFGKGNDLLSHKLLKLEGDNSIQKVSLTPEKSWPDYLSLRLLYFKDGRTCTYSREIRNQKVLTDLPLSFTRFTDTTAPGGRCTLAIGTEPGVECALAVFDKSSETIMPNDWPVMQPETVYYGTVYYRNNAGSNGSVDFYPIVYRTMNASNVRVRGKAMTASLDMVEEESVALDAAPAMGESLTSAASAVSVRSDFASTIAWTPFLRSDKNGLVEYSFTASDKLSTFVVQLFAHDKQMRNAVLRKEMIVTLPVKVAVVQPQFLIVGDRYGAAVTLSNCLDSDVAGTLSCRFIDGDDYKNGRVVTEVSKPIRVPAGSSAAADFMASVPEDVKTLGMLVTFRADNPDQGSDAVFVTIPIHPDVQTITEAHSAVLLSGADRDALIARLRSEFVNVPGSAAELSEIDILQMLRDAIPAEVEPRANDALSLVNALYSNVLAELLGAKGMDASAKADLVTRILACQNSDKGFGWIEGMRSSPVVTAVLMERFARIAAKGWAVPEEVEDAMLASASYLDDSRFGDKSARPVWCGGISLGQYLYVRALYPQAAFNSSSATAKELREFRKSVRSYLVPTRVRGLNGNILPKLRRVLTLKALSESSQGLSLAISWGIRLATRKRLSKSMEADVQSELQYLVPHWAGGCYYPNAVMPYRGLLESELYAHVMLCDMLAATGHDTEADGIRLWIMIQKETQKWDSDPAYLEAIGCVMDGSDELKATKVVALKATATLPLQDVKASGNDMKVERRWFLISKGESLPVEEGQVLHVGDELRAEYSIWNRENRSFVLLTAPRPAAFRPADQLSGYYGWWLRPISVNGWISFSPQGYRSVFADRTEYRFDSYPEENTTISERFFVTQEGTFHTPAVTIESLYAPHYRANDAGCKPVVVEP